MKQQERFSFNVNAELYENRFGELAVKIPGKKVFGKVGLKEESRFQTDIVALLEEDRKPPEWSDMPLHQLAYQEWKCIAILGYIDGDPQRPAIEFEVDRKEMGAQALAYLKDALRDES